MPEESNAGREWVVEPPPAPGEMSLYFAAGEGVELTDDQQTALGELLRSLEADDPEVVGLKYNCPDYQQTCNPLQCGKVTCYLNCKLNKVTAMTSGDSGGTSWALMGSFAPRIG